MTSNDLKIFSMFYIAEHDNLNQAQKMDLYEFVKKADSFSVMNFLTNGHPIYVPTRYRMNVVESFIKTPVGSVLVETPSADDADPDKARHAARDQTLSQAHDVENDKTDAWTGKEMGGTPESKHASTPDGSYNKPDSFGQKVRDAKNAVGDAADWVKDMYKGGVEAMAKRFVGSDIGVDPSDNLGHAAKLADMEHKINMGMAGVGASTVAAIVGFLGYKVYKNYFSQAARACKAAPDKKACMAKVRAGSITQAAKAIGSKKSICKKSSNPAQCAAKIDKKLAKMKAKLGTLKK